jgi:cell division protein FtsN
MATENATPEKMTLDRSDGSATIALYRAALGPVHTDDYLKAFTRFDAAGKTSPLWNWTAALLTLNWLLFRQLWVAALAYTGALVAAVLLLVGIARLVFQISSEAQWLLAGLALLLAVGLPGALGNAWLYAACNKKMERALVASATLEEACTLLAGKAPGRKQMVGLLAGNLALGALLVGLVVSWPDSKSLPLDPVPQTPATVTPALHSGLVTQAVGSADVPQVLASEPAPAASAPLVVASAPPVVSRTSQGVVQPAELPAMAAPAPAAQASAAAPAAAVPAVAPETHQPPHKAKAEKAVKAGKVVKPARAPAAPVSPATEGSYLINVGLFADANNARNAVAKLQDAGLAALSRPVQSAKGARPRVRVGPFETRAEAERVAEKIRGLKLEAQVFGP